MNLAELTSPELIYPNLGGADGQSILRAMAGRTARSGALGDADEDDLLGRLLEREGLGSTGIGSGVAIPHCKLPAIEAPVIAVGMAPRGVEFGAVDAKPVRVFFLLVSPEQSPVVHLQCLAAISRWLKVPEHVERLTSLDDPQAIVDFLAESA